MIFSPYYNKSGHRLPLWAYLGYLKTKNNSFPQPFHYSLILFPHPLFETNHIGFVRSESDYPYLVEFDN